MFPFNKSSGKRFYPNGKLCYSHYTQGNTTNKRSRYISTETKQIVWNRDGGRCVQCDSMDNIEYDHDIPHSKGGSNGPNNVQLLCFACNRSKSAKIK